MGEKAGKNTFIIVMISIIVISVFLGLVTSDEFDDLGNNYSESDAEEREEKAYEMALADAEKYFTDIEMDVEAFDCDDTYDGYLTNVVDGYMFADETGYMSISVDLEAEEVLYNDYDYAQEVATYISHMLELPVDSTESYDYSVTLHYPYLEYEYDGSEVVETSYNYFYECVPGSYFGDSKGLATKILAGETPFTLDIDIENHIVDADTIYNLMQEYPAISRYQCENYTGTSDYKYNQTGEIDAYVDSENGCLYIEETLYENVEADGIIVHYATDEIERQYDKNRTLKSDDTYHYSAPTIEVGEKSVVIDGDDENYFYIYTRDPDLFSKNPYYIYYGDEKEKLKLVEITDMEMYYLAEEDYNFEESFYGDVEIYF